MSKFTPGPWEVKRGGNFIAVHPVCQIYQSDKSLDLRERDTREAMANAQLIASAPAMIRDLEALIKLLDAYSQMRLQSIEAQDILARARLTIANAIGGQD